MNYESEVDEIILAELKRHFLISDTFVLFNYLYMRFVVENYGLKFDKYIIPHMLCIFIFNELNIPIVNNCVLYKKEMIKFYCCEENSMENILSNWKFQSSFKKVVSKEGVSVERDEYIKTEVSIIIANSKKKAKSFLKNEKIKVIKYYSLLSLDEKFHVSVTTPQKIQGFHYPKYHNLFARTLEEKYDAEMNAIELQRKDTATFSEYDLQQYLKKNLNIIEDGLKFIESEFVIDAGRIDILAMDKNKRYVILELKTNEDKNIIWQATYYPKALKSLKHIQNIRMFVISPKIPRHILNQLICLPEVEVFEYIPNVEFGKIKNLIVKRI